MQARYVGWNFVNCYISPWHTLLERSRVHNRTTVFSIECLPPRLERTDVQWSQIRFNGSEPRVVGLSWRSFPVWWKLANRSSNCVVMVFIGLWNGTMKMYCIQNHVVVVVIIIIIIFYPRWYRSPGKKLEAKNKYPWWLEVGVFVREAEGVRNQSRFITPKQHNIQRTCKALIDVKSTANDTQLKTPLGWREARRLCRLCGAFDRI